MKAAKIAGVLVGRWYDGRDGDVGGWDEGDGGGSVGY